MDEEKKESFEFEDRRRARADAPAEEAPAPEAGPPEEVPGAQAADEQPGPEASGEAGDEAFDAGRGMPEVDIYTMLISFVGYLNSFAWQKMGLIADRATGQAEVDLPQARTAIDTVQFIAGQLEPKLPPADVRELRRMVMDLQMNYVRVSSGS